MDGASDKPKPKHVKGYDRMHDYSKMFMKRELLIVMYSMNLGSHDIFYTLKFLLILLAALDQRRPQAQASSRRHWPMS